eukprot:TRINITY_DN8529_c0_g1_i1.p1 TRINITY_DN8529_c0_g1~~TRINITY_DN8529_c0_g1_i1.p1  ORF type:complete len:505 (-),score=108.83 TRINITY_DN8529_c0_g1_i1:62-1576(-)
MAHQPLPSIPPSPTPGSSGFQPEEEVMVLDPLPVSSIRSASLSHPLPTRVMTPQVTHRKEKSYSLFRARKALAGSHAESTAHAHPQPDKEEEEKQRNRYFVLGEEFVIDERYTLEKRLGEGSYGVVCSALDSKRNGQKVAIKKVIDVFFEHSRAKKVLREVKLLTFLGKHPCIMKTLDILNPLSKSDFESIYIITEYVKTDLSKIIRKEREIIEEAKNSGLKSPILGRDQISWITFQMLCVLKYLKSAKVIHRDIKPDNVLINPDCSIRLCDFGLARGVKHSDDTDFTEEQLTAYVVTRWYRAPEVLCSAGRYSYSIDLWALGCMLAEMFSKTPLFPGKESFEQLKVIFSTIGCPQDDELRLITYPPAAKYIKQHIISKIKPIASQAEALRAKIPDIDPDALDLLCKIFVFDPKKRISVEDALQHPFFEQVYDEQLVEKSESKEAFDFEYENMTRTVDNIRHLMFEEIVKFRPFALEDNPLEDTDDKAGQVSRHKKMLDFQKSC